MAERALSEQEAPRNRAAKNHEEKLSEKHGALKTPDIYAVVRQRGIDEMRRPATSLWWSGVAAGLSISFSLLAQALLELAVPDASWKNLVTALGYPVGFVMVVLSGQQLFTETTITAVLPLMADFKPMNAARMARMWSIVLIANTVGTLIAALFCSFTPVLPPETLDTMREIGERLFENGPIEMFFKAISAGFLMAAMVWLIPSAGSTQLWIVVLMTYLIGAGNFVHIVGGSVETFLLVLHGDLGLPRLLLDFTLPALAGNIVGGTALFALISYAQVMNEI